MVIKNRKKSAGVPFEVDEWNHDTPARIFSR